MRKVSFMPRPLYPGKISLGTHWIGGWVGPGVGLDAVEERKYLILPGLELRLSVVQPVACRYTDWAIPASTTEKASLNKPRSNMLTVIFEVLTEVTTSFCHQGCDMVWGRVCTENILKIEAAGSSETFVNVYLTTQCHMPEDSNLQQT
jgi:hypothetical protein